MNLEEARKILRSETHHERWNYTALAAHLETLAANFSRADEAARREMTAEFHNFAGRLPYVDDCDFGALVLEHVADSTPELRSWLLTEASIRARMCVQGATAGGELISRAQHLEQIQRKIDKATP